MLIVEGNDRGGGDPALSKWSFGLNSRLVLGSPSIEVQLEIMISGFDPLLS